LDPLKVSVASPSKLLASLAIALALRHNAVAWRDNGLIVETKPFPREQLALTRE
jgi:hypothetical protein